MAGLSPFIKEHDSEYQIYDALVRGWLKREESKDKGDFSAEHLLFACTILAILMFMHRSLDTLYYDRLHADRFEDVFQGMYIYRRPTPRRHTCMMLLC